MGSKSRSNSSQTTENYSTTFGIQGANNGLILNGNGNTVTDGGAFKLVGDIVDLLPDVFTSGFDSVNNGFSTVEELADMGANQNSEFLTTGLDLFAGATDLQNNMLELSMNNLTETGEILSDGFNQYTDANQQITETVIESNRDTTELAFNAMSGTSNNMAELASEAMMNNADLSTVTIDAIERANSNNVALADRAIESAETVTFDSQKQLASGFNEMLGFAERYSRSDGAALAADNNKSMLMLVGGVGVTIIVVALITTRGKK